MSQFEAVDLSGEILAGICAECLRHGVRHECGFTAVRCTHSSRGAWRAPGRSWHFTPPVSTANFIKAITRVIATCALAADIFSSAETFH